MSFAKFLPTRIFDGRRFLEPGRVLITETDGTIVDIVQAHEAGEDLQSKDGILVPGFVNAHCHLELSHLKEKIAEGSGLVDFVFQVVSQRDFDVTEIEAAITLAENEMLGNGIVAVGDICNNSSSLGQKLLGRMEYYNFVEISGWNPLLANERFARSGAIVETFNQAGLSASLVPHAPYSVSDALWKLLEPAFAGKTISIHNQETIDENKFFLNGTGDLRRMYELMKISNAHFKPTGKSSLASFLPLVQKAGHLVLVHNTYTSEEDMLLVKEYVPDHSWCICINANLYIEKAVPSLQMLRAGGGRIVLGTDSLASNHQLDILAEIRTIQQYFPGIRLSELLQWATFNGAMALNMHEKLGSFSPGLQPGGLLLKGVQEDENVFGATIERLF